MKYRHTEVKKRNWVLHRRDNIVGKLYVPLQEIEITF